ncbi:MAG TPA: APC family permease [Nocardioides sp.]
MSERSGTATKSQEAGEPELKRAIGPGLLLLFIIGDIVGAGIFAVTGTIAGHVGGMAWLPFLVAFGIATVTACSYLEMVTKYPEASGAALYVHKAFGLHFVTFIVAFTVMCSGITSAATSSNLVAGNLLIGLDEVVGGVPTGDVATLLTALAIIVVLALINLRGVSESVKFNVVLTVITILALSIVIAIGLTSAASGEGDLGRVVVFESSSDQNMFAAVTVATAVAFFAMVGFEDSVNMVEETKNPLKIFPRMMLTGLGLCAVLYVLVAVTVVLVIPLGDITDPQNPDAGILLDVVRIGAPDIPVDTIFPFLTVFAVVNTALINMLMASRLIYGMAKQGVLPRVLGRVLPGRRSPWVAIVFTTLVAMGLITYVRLDSESDVVPALGGTTALLLLAVFAVVNVCVLVLRRDPTPEGAFRTPTVLPVVGALLCAYLVGPWARVEEQYIQYEIAGALLVIGVVLWAVTWFTNRALRSERTGFRDVEDLDG